MFNSISISISISISAYPWLTSTVLIHPHDVCNRIDQFGLHVSVCTMYSTRTCKLFILTITVKMIKIRESVDGTHSCSCRRDMAWNSRTLECQVFPINPASRSQFDEYSTRKKSVRERDWKTQRGTSCVLSPWMYHQPAKFSIADVSGRRLQGSEVHLCTH